MPENSGGTQENSTPIEDQAAQERADRLTRRACNLMDRLLGIVPDNNIDAPRT